MADDDLLSFLCLRLIMTDAKVFTIHACICLQYSFFTKLFEVLLICITDYIHRYDVLRNIFFAFYGLFIVTT